jgi:addiction module HigA family antidote
MPKKLAPVHPGEILVEDFMEPLGLSAASLGRALDIPPNRISQIIQGKRALTVDTALRLEQYFKVSATFWMNLQQNYDLALGRDSLLDQIKATIKPAIKGGNGKDYRPAAACQISSDSKSSF